jgi:diguanylate cyclase (GGDEF)-like protein
MWGPAVVGGLALVVASWTASFPAIPVLLLVAALTAAAERIRFPLPTGGHQTLSAAVTLPAIVLLGPVATAWASSFGVLIGDRVLRRRRRWSATVFYAGQRNLTILIAGTVWGALLGRPGWLGHPGFDAAGQSLVNGLLGLLISYAGAATILLAAFLSVSRHLPFWGMLATEATWRLPATWTLGAFGLAVAGTTGGIPIQTATETGYLLSGLLAVSLIALLLASRRQQLKEIANLHGAMTDLLHTLDLRDLLAVFSDRVARLTDPDMLWITLRRVDGGYEVPLARTPGIDPTLLTTRPREGDVDALGLALTGAQPQRIADYLRDPRKTSEAARLFGLHRVRAVLAMPLRAAGEPVGMMTLTKPVPGYFTEHHEELVGALTAQAAVVVRNAQLYQTSQRVVARFEALKAISERTSSQQDLRNVFDLIADSAREILGADRFALFLGEPGRVVTHSFTRGLSQEHVRTAETRLREGIGLGSLAMKTKEPRVSTDVLADPIASHTLAMKAGYRTVAVFPLKYREMVIGVMNLYHNEIHPYGESDVELGRALANQAAIAVQNARLLQEAERRAHQHGLLNLAFTRVAASLSPGELFDLVAEELHTTLGYTFVMIQLIDEDQLRHVADRGYIAVKQVSPLAAGIMGRVARTGEPALATDVARDPDYIQSDPRVTQEACVPIVHQGRVIGVINAETIQPRLTQTDLDLLTTLAGYAAIALEKAELHEQTRAFATTDGLTGLFNYRAFWQALDREIERSTHPDGAPLSLLLVEIDKFKRYNDTYGHLKGDEVLRLVARVLRQESRVQIDFVARYGGDEFMLLLPRTTKREAAVVADRIRRAMETTPFIADLEVASVTLSLGVASSPEDGRSAGALVEAADRSMYRAKKQGGNAVALAMPS